jgi:hypothetical protein
MGNQLENLRLDLVNYRQAVDQIFIGALTAPRDWQQRFREILSCSLQLYLDYLLVVRDLPTFESISSKGSVNDRVRADAIRERSLRERLKQKLESSTCWSYFNPKNSFSELTGLCSLKDYWDKFTLHLPEIYEETFRVEACVKDFLARRDESSLAQIVIGLQHLGRNHISFLLQALEWASDDNSWEDG